MEASALAGAAAEVLGPLGGPLGWLLALALVAVVAVPRMFARAARNTLHDSPLRGGARIPTVREALPDLRRELDRVRRHERPLAVVVLKPEAANFGSTGGGGAPIPAGYAEHIIFLEVGVILRDFLRDADRLAVDLVGRRYVLVLPESDRAEAARTVSRLAELVLMGTGSGLRKGVAEFWRDGLIVEDLVEAAGARCDLTVVDGSGEAAEGGPTDRRTGSA